MPNPPDDNIPPGHVPYFHVPDGPYLDPTPPPLPPSKPAYRLRPHLARPHHYVYHSPRPSTRRFPALSTQKPPSTPPPTLTPAATDALAAAAELGLRAPQLARARQIALANPSLDTTALLRLILAN